MPGLRNIPALSEINDQDRLLMRDVWEEVAPSGFENALTAEDYPTEEGLATAAVGLLLLFWSERLGRFVRPNGSVVSPLAVRDALEEAIAFLSKGTRAATQGLVDGTLALAEWQTLMVQNVKTVNGLAGALARGGLGSMRPNDWVFVEGLIGKQLGFLDGFINELASGTQALNGLAVSRADMYMQAARGVYEAVRTKVEQDINGMNQERRVLGVADHCEGCMDQADLGWQPIGTTAPIGSMECLTNCHCHKEYRKV